MIIGVDSYVSLADADAYIVSHYRSTNAARKRWAALEEADKEVLLVQACAAMESLPYPGRKVSTSQALAFPRLPLQYGNAQAPPAAILHAQIETALYLTDEAAQESASKRQSLRDQGVTSYSIDDLSETYSDVPARAANTNPAMMCPAARQLLSRYLSGGYATC